MSEATKKEITAPVFRRLFPSISIQEQRDAHPISAQEVVEAIKGGMRVEIENAVIEGPFMLRSVAVEAEVTIKGTLIKGPVDWSFAIFKQVVNLKNSTFAKTADFRSIRFERDADFEFATFKQADFGGVQIKELAIFSEAIFEEAIFTGAQIDSEAQFVGTTFKNIANFNSACFGNSAHFKAALFKGEADFTGVHIRGNAEFNCSLFYKAVSFNEARIDKAAFFRLEFATNRPLRSVVFSGAANFGGVRIGTTICFDDAIFSELATFSNACIGRNAYFNRSKFKKKTNFNKIEIKGEAFFNQTFFEDTKDSNAENSEDIVDFGYARIGGNANFMEAIFKKQAVFNNAYIHGSVFFIQASFEKGLDFSYFKIGGNAEYKGAMFKKNVFFNSAHIEKNAFFTPNLKDNKIFKISFEGEVDFTYARIDGVAVFRDIEFKKEVKFDGSMFARDVVFGGTIFEERVSFLNTSFATIFCAEPNLQRKKDIERRALKLKANIDLRGCTYNRIEPYYCWIRFMKALDPYDRQAYTMLEEIFRRTGEDQLANKVYFEGRRERAKKKIQKWNIPALFKDWFLRLLTGYGVRLHRLIVAIALILLIGTFFFQNEGAVEQRQNNQLSQVAEAQSDTDGKLSLTWKEAFWISVNHFLPVKIPAGGEWMPSSKIIWGISSKTFATLLTLTGWILVPVGLAGISGILKR